MGDKYIELKDLTDGMLMNKTYTDEQVATVQSSIDTVDAAVVKLDEDKVDKVAGKTLSDNNFSNAEKEKLSSLENYDDSELQSRMSSAETAIGNLQASGYDDTAISARVTANEAAISALNGTGAGSVSKTVSDAIDTVVAGAPNTFDTLKEIADWIQDDQTGAAALAADVANKVDKADGKGLSTEDFTTAEKTKLSGLENYDDTALVNRVSDAEQAIETLEQSGYDDTAIKGRVTDLESALDGHTVGKDVPSDAAFTDTVYDDTALTSRVTAVESSLSGKVDAVSGKGLSTEDYTTAEKTKLAGLSNYDDTALAGRVTAAETALTGKANTSDLATVATSGSYDDLTDKPAAYELPTASDTTLGGIKVNSTSGATVEDGVLKVTQQSGTGGGAIPAYIVGDTMLPGWLSETENGEALTPVDKQEYVIMTSGEWLRKHVMWVEELGIYRLTGKVEVADEVQREILKGVSTQNIKGGGGQNAETYTADKITVSNGSTIRFKLTWGVQANSTVDVMVGNNVLDTIVCTQPSDDVQTGSYDKTFKMTSEYNGLHPAIRRNGKGGSWGIARASNIEITYTDNYLDYETDDVIDITESEIETIWGETAGAADPTNNVFSTEERLWGYWIDGKPIYRKTFTESFALPESTGSLADKDVALSTYGITNVNEIIKVEGMLDYGSGTYTELPWSNSNNVVTLVQILEKTTIRYRNTYKADNTLSGVITLYYTKTT